MNIDRVILGDNQFFGVNHLNEEKGRVTREKFKDIEEIKKMLHASMDLGVNAVFFSTHPDIYKITEMMKADSRLKTMAIYVNIPYIVKYVSMFNTLGPLGTLEQVLNGSNFAGKLKLFSSGLSKVLTLDPLGIFNKIIDIELLPFKGLNVKSVLLHNSLCDLALAYDLPEVIKSFNNHIVNSIGAIPGFGTQNYPEFCKLLRKAGLTHSFVMTIINKLGFSMNPNRESYERALNDYDNTVLAMATLASGRLTPEEAYEYLGGIGIKHICVGMSTSQHAKETFDCISRYIK